jgi:hypothetical protein
MTTENPPQRGVSPILQYFNYEHLPEYQQNVAHGFFDMAHHIEAHIPGSAEKSAGLRKLLEAKDCIVRASLPAGYPENLDA